MSDIQQIRFAPAVSSMRDYLGPHTAWFEKVLGCPYSNALVFDIEVPVAQVLARDLLPGVPIDYDRSQVNARREIDRWELPSGFAPRINLTPSRGSDCSLTNRSPEWSITWRDCPIAIWLKGQTSAFVIVEVPFVSFAQGLTSGQRRWLIVDPQTAPAVLAWLAALITQKSGKIVQFGADDLSFTPNYDWNSVTLDPSIVRLVQDDFEMFFKREKWFRDHGLPFRRGYFFHGPPGNGKTSVIKVMASHPLVTPFTVNFQDDELNNKYLTGFFDTVAKSAPALLILEDLDRNFAKDMYGRPNSNVTMQHFLNCLDGVATQDGVITVATANETASLDAAILKRPGRFDRVIEFSPPGRFLRASYLHRLSRGDFELSALSASISLSDGFSFAQLRESYILSAHLSYESGEPSNIRHLRTAFEAVNKQMVLSKTAGFTTRMELDPADWIDTPPDQSEAEEAQTR